MPKVVGGVLVNVFVAYGEFYSIAVILEILVIYIEKSALVERKVFYAAKESIF